MFNFKGHEGKMAKIVIKNILGNYLIIVSNLVKLGYFVDSLFCPFDF